MCFPKKYHEIIFSLLLTILLLNPECIMGCFQIDTVFQSYKQIENSCVILISRNIWAINERNSCNNTAQLMKTREILFYICMHHVCMYVWGHLLMYIINTTNVNINVWQIISTVPRGEEIMGLCQSRSKAGGEVLTSCAESQHKSITEAQFYSHRPSNA